MSGDDVFTTALDRLLTAGASFSDAMTAAMLASWRGAEEPVRTIPVHASDQALHVGCVCGHQFVFRPGATRARCPGCGARYELQE